MCTRVSQPYISQQRINFKAYWIYLPDITIVILKLINMAASYKPFSNLSPQIENSLVAIDLNELPPTTSSLNKLLTRKSAIILGCLHIVCAVVPICAESRFWEFTWIVGVTSILTVYAGFHPHRYNLAVVILFSSLSLAASLWVLIVARSYVKDDKIYSISLVAALMQCMLSISGFVMAGNDGNFCECMISWNKDIIYFKRPFSLSKPYFTPGPKQFSSQATNNSSNHFENCQQHATTNCSVNRPNGLENPAYIEETYTTYQGINRGPSPPPYLGQHI